MSVAESVQSARTREASLASASSAVPMFAGLAAVKLIIQFAGIHQYGFFRDELYYLACGRHLAWGYIDQPPLVALVAWIAQHLLGGSIVAVRLLPVLSGATVVVFTGLLARELGGQRFAQFLAALTILFAPSFLAFDSFLSMNAFEPLLWVICAWLVVRIAHGASPRLWLAFGAAAGVGLENKHTMIVFGFAIVAGLVLAGQARLLLSRWAWLGAAVALLIFLPNLLWEARHGWPQIEVVRNAQQFKNEPVSVWRFLGEQALFLDPVTLPVWFGGLVWLLFAPQAKRFRFLGIAYLVVLGIFMFLGGKTYYPLPIYPVLIAAGATAVEMFAQSAFRWLRGALAAIIVAGGLAGLPLAVPVLPLPLLLRYSNGLSFTRVQTERDSAAQLSQLFGDMIPWQEMSVQIATVYHSLPTAEQHGCAIFGGNYGEAGAIDYYGPALGLPSAISGHNSYYDWGPRGYSGSCVVVFGERAQKYTQYFGQVTLAVTLSNPLAMPAEQSVPVYICREPKAPLAALWPHFRMII